MNLLSEWFSDSPSSDRRICVVELPSSKFGFHLDAESAMKAASTLASNAYFGVGLIGPVSKGRGKAADVVGIGGLWVDLDWRSTKINKPLAGSFSTLLSFVATLPISPSVLVDTGGGIHAYWIFKEPWIFETQDENAKAAALALGWHEWINRQAPAWQLENCGDLARVLRVPGTMNRKYGEPVLCRVHSANDRRFVPQDFEDYQRGQEPKQTTSPIILNGRADDTATEEKFLALCEANQTFKSSFDHDRADLPDVSSSGYDLSLTTIAAANGWANSELAWLIGKHRNFWGDKPEKAERQDYVSRTIGKARSSAAAMVELTAPTTGVDISGILNQAEEKSTAAEDPGPTPANLLSVPGFISELTDHTLATAPYPNAVLAFSGALAMQSLLAARRVRDSMNNRTNLYLLALAQSGSGKDWPRKVNVRLAHEAGFMDQIGDRFASGEGLEDALARSPAMLFQTDEIDGMLQTINSARDGRADSIMTAMLNFYSQSNAIYKTRKRAGKEGGGTTIHDPSLTIYGTAIPKHYYDAVSDKMLTNGFFARVISFDAGERGRGQESEHSDLPPRVVEIAKAWGAFGSSAQGNLGSVFPDPPLVDATEGAKRALFECREFADAEYKRCSDAGDEGGMSIWARTWERSRKLALIYACSSQPLESLQITETAARWGADVSIHQTKRSLYLINLYRADGEFAGKVSKLLSALRRWHHEHGDDAWMQFRLIGQKLRWTPREHEDVAKSLRDTDQIEIREVKTDKRPRREYRLTRSALRAGR